jgi:hypothetical protein
VFNTTPHQPDVDGVGSHQSKRHPDLHHEPVGSLVGPEMGVGEQDEDDKRHPPEQPNLECDQREGVGLDGTREGLARSEPAHRLDGEVLEKDTEQIGENEVEDVLGPERHTGDGHAGGEDSPLAHHVTQHAASTAVRRRDG